jgi:hypothetical protein
MTKQEIFDKVWKRAQDPRPARRRRATGWTCVYRQRVNKSKTRCCFIGALIPDELYDPKMENQNVDTVLEVFDKVKELLDPLDENAELLQELQQVHDRRAPDVWNDTLWTIARDYGLVVPEETTA